MGEAKNKLEGYCYQVKKTFDEEEKKKHIAKADEYIQYVEDNQSASKADYEAKQKEAEDYFNPIMTKLYQDAGGAAGGMPGGGMSGAGAEQSSGGGVTIEEVD